jgi:hypothetical protein
MHQPRCDKPDSDARECLIRDAHAGGITLVLGAGVASACQVATWRELARCLWRDAFGCDMPHPADDPRFYPFVFERVQNAMPEQFPQRLKEILYASHRLPSRDELARCENNSLAVLARVIASEAQAPQRRLKRVITLNVDDLLERAVTRLSAPAPTPVQPIVRASANLPHADRTLPIYHLHGYLRSEADGSECDDAPDVLVFTDQQYWASAAVPSSHMNRTFSFALHDSHCVFIGTSMTDLNIWRWLALRSLEIAQDFAGQRQTASKRSLAQIAAQHERSLERHYWITCADEPEQAFLSECLALRGVRTVRIQSWNEPSFCELMSQCYPRAAPLHGRQLSHGVR